MTTRQKLLIAVVVILIANVWMWTSNKERLAEFEAQEQASG